MANQFARSLRKNPTDPERKLWLHLRYNQFHGFRFRRQQPIGSYVADFFCAAGKLIVELDGGQHGIEQHLQRDEVRTRWLAERGYRVIRFWKGDVLTNLDGVLEGIEITLRDTPTRPHRAKRGRGRPPPQGGRRMWMPYNVGYGKTIRSPGGHFRRASAGLCG
jgi:very-short-patch-repair endonuclease